MAASQISRQTENINALIEKIERPLPSREEKEGKRRKLFRLELTRSELSNLSDALYLAIKRADKIEELVNERLNSLTSATGPTRVKSKGL